MSFQIEERLDLFMRTFDIVLLDDQSMDFVCLLLKLILKGPSPNPRPCNILELKMD